MSAPSAVFLDTSVFDGQQYNFASTALRTFIPAAKKAGLTLLLPDPTEREIARHIRERAKEALDALEVARRRAPFLEKWESFPKAARPSVDSWQVTVVATKEWDAFLSEFNVVKLGYESIVLRRVMDWYDMMIAPFGQGKKRKEFPDAFAVAILQAYAEKHGCFIAVVSEDPDFKLACDRYANLLHFQTVPRLTELLLSVEDNIPKLHAAIEANAVALVSAIRDQVGELSFYHEDERFEITESSTSEPSADEINIVAVGDSECTVTFESSFEAEHRLRWDEDGDHDMTGVWITESATVSGTAKLVFDRNTGEFTAVKYVALDAEEIGVSKTPRHAAPLYR